MTYDEAIDFLAVHGNVARQPDRLKAEPPTLRQLERARDYSVQVAGQAKEVADAAFQSILVRHGEDLAIS